MRFIKPSFYFFIFIFFIIAVPLCSAGGETDLAISEEGIRISDTTLGIGETVTIYAEVENLGSQAEAMVRFYEGDQRTFIGEVEITVWEDSSELVKISWEPYSENHLITVSVENVFPQDVDLKNNEAMSFVNFNNRENELKISPHKAMVESGIERVIPIEVKAMSDISDVDLLVIYDGDLDITLLSPPHSFKSNEVTKFYVKVKVPHLRKDQIYDNRTLLIQAIGENAESNLGELKISIHTSFEEGDWWYPSIAVAAGTMGVLAVVGSSEVGKYRLISFIGPLYTKLTREEILDHYTRGKIHGYVLANPGEHYNSIRKALGIPNGSFAYHLQVLERECMIKSRRDGLYKRFYPYEAKIPETKKFRLNDTQKIIMGRIAERPGISQGDIAQLLGVKPSTVNYHMNRLQTAGLVNSVRKGISVKYYLSQ